MGFLDSILGLSGGGTDDDQALAFNGAGGASTPAPPSTQAPAGGGILPDNGGRGGLLQSVLGVSPGQGSRLRSGLGAGLTAAAANSDKPGLAAFAAGAGGALTGGEKADQQQFTNSISALDRAIKSKSEGDMDGYRKAMIDYHNASLAETSKYHQGLLDRGNFSLIPGTGVDDSGQPVAGSYKLDSRSGTQEFQPNVVVNPRGSGGNAQGQTERLIATLQKENPNLSTAEAIALTKRAPSGNMESLRREGLALNAAKADPKYFSDPDKTLEAYRLKYGLGGAASAATPAPSQATPQAPGAPIQQQRPSAGKPAEISMKGQGTKEAPYTPSSADDYAQIEAGSYYLHPSGQIRIKK